MLRTLILCIVLITALSPKGFTQSYWQQEVNYTIDVSLNDIEHTLDGFVRMKYTNHSPDTLSFIWIHCWPNAYKTDRTAFSDQLLENGRTDFYFSEKERKGYINRLDFRVDGTAARVEDHPRYIDIEKILLPSPLPPGGSILITTPFHEKLPFPFSRGGYTAGAYQMTQWYPKPAVYDKKGWHEMPYLDQGEFYGEFGNYDVHITLPATFVVGATGVLQTAAELEAYKHTGHAPSATATTKTLDYHAENVHDFAWFADKRFHVAYDTLQLPSGKIIDVFSYYTPKAKPDWQHSLHYIKDAIRFRSALIGDYPFPAVSIAAVRIGSGAGMEYPGIAAVSAQLTGRELDHTIEHEIGHNWFYAALATNERRYPWMDEGMNTYYDQRYLAIKYPPGAKKLHANNDWLQKKIPQDPDTVFLNTLIKEKKDQPISTSSEDFASYNYDLIPYDKAAAWMRLLRDSLGKNTFDTAMRSYYEQWSFKHPYPQDFRAIMEGSAHRDLDTLFHLLDKKGSLYPAVHRPLKPSFLFSANQTDKYDYINLSPAVGNNKYDGGMIGLLIHNYNLPPDHFQFFAAPLYATNSHQWNGIGRVSYGWYPDKKFQKIEIALSGEKFSSLSATDSNANNIFGGFYKITPSVRLTLLPSSPRSTLQQWIEWKTFLIGERGPAGYVIKSTDSLNYPNGIGKYAFRYLNQLSYHIEDKRILYPYRATLQLQQADRFYRINFTGNYFFNYSAGGGMEVRLFAAKFGYLGGRSNSLDLTSYEPKLTGVSGSEDYTYSNYFYGRNEFNGFASQQIMDRDGGLKIRVPIFPWLEGRSDNWVSSLDLTTTLPSSIVPSWLPLKAFWDIGTYAGGWQNNALTSRFLYVGGLQLSLFHNMLNFYAPLFYSSDFSSQLKTVPDQNTFWKKLSFSIDIQNFDLRKFVGNIPL